MRPALTNYFADNKLDAILITDLNNVRFLTGFTGTNGLALVTQTKNYFLTDSRYTEQAKRQVKGCILITVDRGLLASIEPILKKHTIKKIGFEAHHLSHARVLQYQKLFTGITLVPLLHDPAELRIVKSAGELTALKKALAINAAAFKKIRSLIKPGRTEQFIARKLESTMLELGAERIAFDTIVASGIRGALPHGVASSKKLKRGELITIDFGCVVNGFHSDETITVALGKPSPELLKIHKIVYEAQTAAFKLAKPGVKCSDLDKAARDYISKAGYGNYFGHALGHGVGLEIHERPVLSANSLDSLVPGMAFTIEPGIYIPGLGGVRIEDIYVCTKGGAKRLSQIDKHL